MFHPIARASLLAGLGLAAFVACSDDSTGPAEGRGTLMVQLTDAPFPVDSVDRVDVFVVRVDVRAAVADSADAAEGAVDDSASHGGWITVAEPNALVNLLDYQNGAVLPVGDTTVAVGSYAGLRLIIDPSESSLTLKNGAILTGVSNPNVSFPSAARSGLKVVLDAPVVIAPADTTVVTIDFDVGNSFVMRGNTILQNGLLFKPVIRASVSVN